MIVSEIITKGEEFDTMSVLNYQMLPFPFAYVNYGQIKF